MNRVFGDRSKACLVFVHPKLRALAELALQIGPQDFTVIEGFRGQAEQDAAFKRGASKVKFPGSAHNQTPALAIDVIPYPFTGWNDEKAFREIYKQFSKAAEKLDVKIRWGGDFNRDGDKTRKDAWDKPHFELHPWRDWKKKA